MSMCLSVVHHMNDVFLSTIYPYGKGEETISVALLPSFFLEGESFLCVTTLAILNSLCRPGWPVSASQVLG